MSSPPDERSTLLEEQSFAKARVAEQGQPFARKFIADEELEPSPLPLDSGAPPRASGLRAVVRPVGIWIVGILVYFLLALTIVLLFNHRPTPVPSSNSASFSEERAMLHEDFLTALGPRPIGSAANIEAKEYILGTLDGFEKKCPGRLQYSERYFKGNSTEWGTWYWNGIGNVAAVIKGYQSTDAFLLSAHYDTVTLSPGAYDDTSSVAMLLDLINVVCQLEQQPKNDLMILFNNAEEIALMGASEFAQSDPLFERVACVANLDCLPGTKSMLFRSQGSYMIDAYAAVPRPLGTVLAQEVAKVNTGGSDTDFSVYLTYRQGLDFAFFDARQRYHTIADDFLYTGSLQFLGDNILALALKLLNTDNLKTSVNAADNIPRVFFDVLGLFFISYNLELADTLHIILAVVMALSIAAVLFVQWNWWVKTIPVPNSNPVTGAFKALGKILLGFLAGLLLSVGIGFIIGAYHPMACYSSTAIAFFTFFFPSLAGFCVVQFAFSKRDELAMRAISNDAKFNDLQRPSAFNDYNFSYWGVFLFWMIIVVATSPLAHEVGSLYLIFYSGLTCQIALIVHHFYCYYSMKTRKDVSPLDQHTFLDMSHEILSVNSKAGVEDHTKLQRSDTIVFTIVSLIPALFSVPLLMWVMNILLKFAGELLPAEFVGTVTALFVLLIFLHFYPWAKQADLFGYVSIICGVMAIVMLAVAMFSLPYTPERPFPISPQQRVDVNTSNGNVIVANQLIMSEEVNHQELSTVLVSLLKYTNWTCNNIGALLTPQWCTVGTGTAPNISYANVTIDRLAPNNETNATRFSVTVDCSTARVHQLTFSNNVSNVRLNDEFITANSAQFSVAVNSSRFHVSFASNMSGVLSLTSNFDMEEDSPALAGFIQTVVTVTERDWITFMGPGTGLLKVTGNWSYSL